MKKPKNMPEYPSKRRQAKDLKTRKLELLSDILFYERAVIGSDFRNFTNLTKARKELRDINERLDANTYVRR